jgi:hypothetical protein
MRFVLILRALAQALQSSLTMILPFPGISGGGGTGAAAAVLSNPTIFELTWDIFGDRGYRHSIHCLWNGLEDRYGLPTTREIMGRVIEGLTDPFLSGRSRAVMVDISPPEAVVGHQHPALLVVEHVSGKILEAIRHWNVYEDYARSAIEDCCNGAIRAVEVPVGVPVGNVWRRPKPFLR